LLPPAAGSVVVADGDVVEVVVADGDVVEVEDFGTVVVV